MAQASLHAAFICGLIVAAVAGGCSSMQKTGVDKDRVLAIANDRAATEGVDHKLMDHAFRSLEDCYEVEYYHRDLSKKGGGLIVRIRRSDLHVADVIFTQ